MLHLLHKSIIGTVTALVATVGVLTISNVAEADPSELPTRVLDTRPGHSTVDGQGVGAGMVGAGSTTVVRVADRANLPGDVDVVSINVTVARPSSHGYITTFACDRTIPTASTLNHGPGQTIAAAALTEVGADGTICLYSSASTHLIVDVTGLFRDGAFDARPPGRLLETRRGLSTVDGRSNGIGRVAAGSTTTVPIAGRGNIPANATAVAANLAIVNPSSSGWATAYPCGQTRPNASNINFVAGQTIANLAITRLGANGALCVYTSAAADIIVDTTSVTGNGVDATFPARLLETRRGLSTVDGRSNGIGRVAAGSTTTVPIAGRGNIPANATAVAANLAIVNPSSSGWATAYPCGQTRPNASNINFVAGQTIANLAITRLGANGALCVYTSAAADIIVDTTASITDAATVPTVDYTPPTSAMSLPVNDAAIPRPASGASTALVGAANYAPVTPSDGVAAFRVNCRFSHMAYDDPIVFPGQPGGSHLHTFAGNTAIDAFSTAQTVANSGTSTCSGGILNRSGYWAPTIVDTATNRPIVPTGDHGVQVYYKSGYQGVAASTVQNVPTGLRMVAGDANRRGPDSSPAPRVNYRCVYDSSGAATPSQQSFPSCSQGQIFVMTIVFPQCWNGRDLDSADHKSHMAYGTWGPVPGQNGAGCPPSHPVPLPEITQNFRYQVPAGGTSTWRLVTDTYDGPAGYSGHADWYNGWHAPTFQRMLDNCFGQNRDCRMNLLGDGQALLPA
jgi:hypothetical protein